MQKARPTTRTSTATGDQIAKGASPALLFAVLVFACILGQTPFAALAREGEIALEDLKRCVTTVRAEARGSLDATEECLSLGFEDCMRPLEGAGYTYKRYGCFLHQFELWQAFLDETYDALLEKTLAGDPKRTRDGHLPAAPKLVEAHLRWLALRDSDCSFAGLRYGRGTLRLDAPLQCTRDRTADRTFMYLHWIETMEF